MNKLMKTGSVICGGMMAFSFVSSVSADNTMNGETTVNSEITEGEVTLEVDATTNFGKKELAPVVNFDDQVINFKVTDYSGTTNGYTITAKLGDADTTRSLKIGESELSNTDATEVAAEATHDVGENEGSVNAALKYTDATEKKAFTSVINWELTKGSTADIAE
ncbi:hypothetical protein [Brochothrix thermosphacta]|uniref:WxL domain-containing protein n=1 Tax=Brochothrix thermosphacta TaxID=2756 RepID=A0A1D2LUC0_BROTH|nr:hypothetical protein [Brochothrix thermosphacta]ATF25653.1 hypothetical protein CNY62_04180 [Brochothrix thermosphacta]ATH84997.1 hypothetical protein CPF12_03805 [Brochothrix thermosphacta]MPQ29591.1 hypothetical protein [Brochothrix thermosphacta]ODJ64049.1 hypothetical protein BFR36_11005 [Brochothrix thermosphacta]ODJ70012.1 hypothetical protein BFR45_11190 [Brochothrix thermosphacta]